MNKKIEIKPKSPKESNLTQIHTRTACQPPRDGGEKERERVVIS
jgi:hypothetical protein